GLSPTAVVPVASPPAVALGATNVLVVLGRDTRPATATTKATTATTRAATATTKAATVTTKATSTTAP
ncbi:MAG: hypothetical protein ACRDY5_10560, partial [Acidimicrobiales bacterium]